MDDYFERLFTEEVSFVHRTLIRLGVAPRDAEDGVQEIFLSVHRRLAESDPTRPARPWLFTFAHHYALNYRRLARHVREHSEHEEELAASSDPERDLAGAEARALVLRALDDLPDERRVVFVAHELEELAAADIATILSIPVNTVYSRLRLAREQFMHTAARLTAAERHRTREGERR